MRLKTIHNFFLQKRRTSAFLNVVFFEMFDALRSRWLLVYSGLIFSFAFFLLYMSSGSDEDVAASLLNFILLLVPLFLFVYGIISFHMSLSFGRVILSTGVTRTSLYMGQYIGRLLGVLPGFALGLLLAFIFAGSIEAIGSFMLLLVYGLLLNAVFLGLSFLISQFSEHLELLIGAAIGIWFLLYILYDSLLLMLVILFGDFPIEKMLLALTMLNPIDTVRSVVLMQGNLQSLMTHSSAIYAKVLSGWVGILVGTALLILHGGGAVMLGLFYYKRRDL